MIKQPPERIHLRIAHLVRAIFPQHGYGGLERAAVGLTTAWVHAGADVTLFTRTWPGRRFEWQGMRRRLELGGVGSRLGAPVGLAAHVVGVPYVVLPLRPNSVAARLTNYPVFVERMGRQVAEIAHADGLDVVYAQGLCAYGVRQVARRRTPHGIAPLVMNPQGLEEFKVRHPLKRLAYAPFRAMYARGAQAADRVIATDESLRGEVARFLQVPAGRVAVLPNGVDPQAGAALVSPEQGTILRARYGLPDNGFLGISVGRLEANKGLPFLLRALALLDRAVPWRWLLVGTGRDRPALEAQAADLGIRDRLVFTGPVSDEDLHNLYALATIFASATLYEGSSLVTLEAMAHGLPVVGTRVGGLPDKVLPGRTGLLVRPGDPAALAGAIGRLLADPDQAAALGRGGAALVQERFTWEAVATQTLRLFEELTRLAI